MSPVGGSFAGGREYKRVTKLDENELQCAYYNIAICKANLNDIQGCLEAISLAFDNGYNEPKRLLKDADFPEAIKQNKFFSDFIEKKIPPFPFSLLSR